MENNKARIYVASNSIDHHTEESRKLLELMRENETKLMEVEQKLAKPERSVEEGRSKIHL